MNRDEFGTFEGRTALVTGSGRNIGAAIAKALAAAGANVVLNVRASVEDGQRVRDEILATGSQCMLIVADVSDSSQVARMTQEAVDRFGAIDILVNNVGVSPMTPLVKTTDEDWDFVLRTSLSSAFYCIREMVEPMVERKWGRIINIGGQASLRGTKFKAANAAAKGGVIGLTREVSNEFAEFGITSNHIGPGTMERAHELVYYRDETKELDPNRKERLTQTIPVGRPGHPDEIAGLCVFLCSDAAGYITGQTILVNGGMMFV
jgi:3-oxoacyl-[acyl-carrier protein] reductase